MAALLLAHEMTGVSINIQRTTLPIFTSVRPAGNSGQRD
jgi:hypothetical protein